MMRRMRGLLALLLCAALGCGTVALAEAPDLEAQSAPVEAPVDEVEFMLEDRDGGEEAFALMAEPEAGVLLEGTGLYAEVEDVALENPVLCAEVGDVAPRAVSPAEAQEGDIGDNVHWALSADGVLTITGQGKVYFKGWENAEGAAAVREVVVCEGITSLPSYCFENCAALVSVSLPATLESVVYGTFMNCTSLERASIAGGVGIGSHAFAKCAALKEVTLPLGLESIGYEAFRECTALEEAALPATVKTIGDSAFYGCKALARVTLPASLESIGSEAFYECEALTGVALPASLTTISEYTFFGCTTLAEVTLPQSLVSIGKYAFGYCWALEAAALPASLTTIGEGAFSSCRSLKAVALPEGMTSVGDSVFSGCKALAELTLPQSLTSIGIFAFSGCEALKEVALPASLTTIDRRAFSGCTSLTEVTIPASVQSVGEGLFFATERLRATTFLGAPQLSSNLFSYWGCAVEVRFLGGVPGFDPETFKDMIIVAFYPGSDPAWTEDVRQNYGGTVTWIDIDGALPETDDPKERSDALKAETKARYIDIIDNGDGTYSRIISTDSGVVVEIYDTETNRLTWKKTIKRELPLYGGFYSGSRYNFLVFGQDNYEEDDSREVVRVVRYTKNWRREAAASVKGANTVMPFSSGNLNMAESGSMLYVHTCHTMYADDGGKNHQANFDFDIYVPTMQVATVRYDFSIFGDGFVSHSFDQYIIRDGDDILSLDLGDGAPRAVVMYRWRGIAGSAVKSGCKAGNIHMLKIAGRDGDNYTGVSLAGLEAGKTHYITAGISVSQAGEEPGGAKNVFVATVPKADFRPSGVQLRWLTSYQVAGGTDLTKPQLVKLGEDSLMLIWTEDGIRTRYVFLDGAGATVSEIQGLDFALTSGRPQLVGGEVRWVYSNGGDLILASLAAGGKLAAPEIKSVAATVKGIRVKWKAVAGAKGYYVNRRSDGTKWKRIATVKGDTVYLDDKAESGGNYCYTVQAYGKNAVSGYNDSGRTVLWLATPKLKSAAGVAKGIRVKWGKVAGATGYTVYRRVGSGKWKKLADVEGKTSYVDGTCKCGKQYRYTVRASYGDLVSGRETPGLAATRLATPTLRSIVNTAKGIQVKWGKVAGATGYTVYRRVGSGKWKKIATVKGKTGYVDTKATKGKAYYYRVRAYCDGSVSGYGEFGRAVTRLVAPTGLRVSGIGSGSWKGLKISWKKVAGATSYSVYRKAGSGKWTLLTTVTAVSKQPFYRDWDVQSGKKYSYRIKAVRDGDTSVYSAATKAKKP